MGDKSVWIALIGTVGPLAAAGVLLASHIWTKGKTNAEAHKSNADAELVTANTLTVVIDQLKAELARVNERVDALEADLEVERQQRREAQEHERIARLELAETDHRFNTLVEHHGNVVEVATDAGVALPPVPPLLAPYLVARQ